MSLRPTAPPPARDVTARAFLAVALLAALGLSGSDATADDDARSGGVEHVVLVWMKDPTDMHARDALIRASLAFKAIDGVIDVQVGGPVESERPVVEDGFDLGIIVHLRDREALSHYLAHPDHIRAGREVLGPEAARVVVYDVEVDVRANTADAGPPTTH